MLDKRYKNIILFRNTNPNIIRRNKYSAEKNNHDVETIYYFVSLYSKVISSQRSFVRVSGRQPRLGTCRSAGQRESGGSLQLATTHIQQLSDRPLTRHTTQVTR